MSYTAERTSARRRERRALKTLLADPMRLHAHASGGRDLWSDAMENAPVDRETGVWTVVFHDGEPGATWTRVDAAEAFDVALIVGGSIVIPHVRHARAILDELAADGAG